MYHVNINSSKHFTCTHIHLLHKMFCSYRKILTQSCNRTSTFNWTIKLSQFWNIKLQMKKTRNNMQKNKLTLVFFCCTITITNELMFSKYFKTLICRLHESIFKIKSFLQITSIVMTLTAKCCSIITVHHCTHTHTYFQIFWPSVKHYKTWALHKSKA